MKSFKSWDKTKNIDLLQCPFCGSDPELIHIGNDHTKKRKVRVKCSNSKCRVVRTDAALIHDFAFLEHHAAKNWNKRTTDQE